MSAALTSLSAATDTGNQEDHDDEDGVSIIRPIEAESVQRIVAGQAVTDLASAVKELVDNALDAGSQSINSTLISVFCCTVATRCSCSTFFLCFSSHFLCCYLLYSLSSSVRLFNQGLDIVEVSDDGCGVPAVSRPYMAHPHATSKIRSFQDIYNDTTTLAATASTSTTTSLGFRGEALFCLANLSEKLVVATRTATEPVGQQMEFRHDGSLNLESIRPVPRKVGTTVAVVQLLGSLPVRRSDMMRRISQQRAKLMRLMEGCT
jgi:DNA mismatch repair protein PMS2